MVVVSRIVCSVGIGVYWLVKWLGIVVMVYLRSFILWAWLAQLFFGGVLVSCILNRNGWGGIGDISVSLYD